MNQAEATKLKAYIDTLITNEGITSVDERGRIIFTTDNQEKPDYNFHFDQPELDYKAVYTQQKKYFKIKMTEKEFVKRAEQLIATAEKNPQYANLMKGVSLPFIVPALKKQDYGTALESIYLPAVEKAYTTQFPDRTFHNYRKGELANQVTHYTNGTDVGMDEGIALLFPTALQGYGIAADREIAKEFNVQLGGAIESALALTAYPALLRDWKTPGIDCAAVSWQSPGYSLLFRADDDAADFGFRSLKASGSCSGSVLFLGKCSRGTRALGLLVPFVWIFEFIYDVLVKK